jgi:hypothetical protein
MHPKNQNQTMVKKSIISAKLVFHISCCCCLFDIDFCLQHQWQLGKKGRESAKAFFR